MKKKILACALFSIFSSHVFSEITLTLDTTKTYQQIDGFGASDAWVINPLIKKWQAEKNEQQIEQLADLFFSEDGGIGLSAWRFNIGAGSEEQGDASQIMPADLYRRTELLQASAGADIDASKQTGQIRFLHEAVERGVSDIVAFSNSPPVWMTKNGLAHPDKDSGSSNLSLNRVDDFAAFLTDVVSYLRDEGIPVNYLSPINEPTWDWEDPKQEGNRYNIQEMKAVYLSVYDALKKAGLHHEVEVDGGESVQYMSALSDEGYMAHTGDDHPYNKGMNKTAFGSYKNYIPELLGDPAVRKALSNKISLHGYFSDNSGKNMGELRDRIWDEIQSASPGASVWMSEICILGEAVDIRPFAGGGWNANDMALAMHVATMIHRDLTRMNASAWHWWLGVTAYDYKDGLIQVSPDLKADSITPSKALWALGQYSKFIRPGYERVSLIGADDLDGLMASAWRDPDSDKLVIVAVNRSDKPISTTLISDNESGMPASMKIVTTSKDSSLRPTGIWQTNTPVSIPAQSIVTFTGFRKA